MIPKTVLKSDWKTAKIELRTAVITPKMEETKLPRESTREGMTASCLLVFSFVCCCLVVVNVCPKW